jgi:hypothetical protein
VLGQGRKSIKQVCKKKKIVKQFQYFRLKCLVLGKELYKKVKPFSQGVLGLHTLAGCFNLVEAINKLCASVKG